MRQLTVGDRVCLTRKYFGEVVSVNGTGISVRWDNAGISQCSSDLDDFKIVEKSIAEVSQPETLFQMEEK